MTQGSVCQPPSCVDRNKNIISRLQGESGEAETSCRNPARFLRVSRPPSQRPPELWRLPLVTSHKHPGPLGGVSATETQRPPVIGTGGLDSHLLAVRAHHSSVDRRFSKPPASCLPQEETTASCGPGRSEGFELRLLFLFGRSPLSSRCLGNRRGCHESAARKRQVWEEPRPRHPPGAGKLGGQLFTAPTDGSDFFFFFSPMETLNHVSAFPVMYIGHDSFQGGLPLPAQTHQPTKDAGH